MATLKRQNVNGEWEIIQLTGEDVNNMKVKIKEIESKILDGSIGENIPPVETHKHINKDVLDKISQDIQGNLIFNGETISADDSSFLVQGIKPEGIEEGRIWVDTSENTYQGIDVNGINSTLDRLDKDNELNKTDILTNKNHTTNIKSITSLEGIHGIRYYNGKLSVMVNNSWVEFQLDSSNSDAVISKLESSVETLTSDNTINKQDIKFIKEFMSTDIATIEGKHGIRYYEKKLSVKVNGEWVEVTSSGNGGSNGDGDSDGGGSSVDGSGLALDGVSRFTIEVASGKNILYWTEPEKDILINGQIVASWAGTKVLRKVGSFPVDENDGTIVVTNRVHNQYARNGFVDLGLENGVEYYYSIFPYTNYGTFSEKKNAKGKPIAQKIYGVRVAKDNSNWDSRVSYIKDATNLKPITLDYDSFSGAYITNWGSWSTIFDSFKIRPCLLKNGIVNYYLNPNNYTLKEDGTPSDVSTGNDGDVMIEFGKTLWWKFTDEGSLSYTVELSDMAFEGAVKHAFEIEEGYNPFNYYPYLLTQILSLILFKSTHPYVFGTNGYSYNGVVNLYGLIAKSSNFSKFLGMEYFNRPYTLIDGIATNSNGDMIIKKNDLGNINYSDEPSHFKLEKNYDSLFTTSSSSLYFNSIQATNEGGFIAKNTGGSSTTFYGSNVSYYANRNASTYGSNLYGLTFDRATTSSFYSRLFYSRNGKIYIGAYHNVLVENRLRSVMYNSASHYYAKFELHFPLIKANNDYVI